MSRGHLDRRTVLRGLGAAIALPFLDAMVPVRAMASTPVTRRFVSFYMPNGRQAATWTPAQEGTGWVAPRCLEPLAPVRDRVRVISGLNSWSTGVGDHDSAARGAMSRALYDPSDQQRWGRSVDVEIATAIGGGARLPMLALSTDAAQRCRESYCDWVAHVSWYDQHTPVPRDRHARTVFERLFGAADPGSPTSAARRAQGRSLLDAVIADARLLKARVAPTDQRLLDEYLTSIREVEVRIDAPLSGACVPATAPTSAPVDPTDAIRAMIDLTVLALRCDVTRVVSLMAGNEGGELGLGFLGHPCCGYHGASHFEPAVHTDVVRWQVGLFTELVSKLEAATEADGGTLLERTFALFLSGMGDSEQHSTLDCPVLLAGEGGVAAPMRGHQAFTGRTLADLHLTLLHAYGIPEMSFGVVGMAPLSEVL